MRHVGDHDETCQAPDNGDDGIDDKEPSSFESVRVGQINCGGFWDNVILPPTRKTISTMKRINNSGGASTRHHLANGLARVVEANTLGHFQGRIP